MLRNLKYFSSVAIVLLFCGPGFATQTLLFFSGERCPACRQMQPTINQLIDMGWVVRQVDVSREAALVQRHHISQIPTCLVLEGGREVQRIVGPLGSADLMARIEINGSSSRARISNDRRPTVTGTTSNHHLTSSNAATRTIRGQSPDVMPASFATSARLPGAANFPSEQDARRGMPMTPAAAGGGTVISPEAAMERAMESTVRIRIDDPTSQAVGTGTIIEFAQGEALVMTCGHLFRDLNHNSQMIIEYSSDGVGYSAVGNLVDFAAAEEDIGFASFRPAASVTASPILSSSRSIEEGMPVFSIGCDSGNAPSIRPSHVTKLNRYLGPDNVEVAGAPVQGRSGGGLFDAQGRIIGICYAADEELDEGLFTGRRVMVSHLQRLGLERLVAQQPDDGQPRQYPTPRSSANPLHPSEAVAENRMSVPVRIVIEMTDGSLRRFDNENTDPELLQSISGQLGQRSHLQR